MTVKHKIINSLILIVISVIVNFIFCENVNYCSNVSDQELEEILGPAYNPRYMSIDEPYTDVMDENTGIKRKVYGDFDPEFYVDSNFVKTDNKPAWIPKAYLFHSRRKRESTLFENLTNSIDYPNHNITARNTMKNNERRNRPWECPHQIKWIDLGRDYFPRYIRTVECLTHRCWYGHYTCKPRSFSVKMLRRRKGDCVPYGKQGAGRVGQQGLPHELRQLWVWEERAVNFCCDCST